MSSLCILERCHHVRYPTYEGASDPGTPVQAIAGRVRRVFSPTFKSMDTYQQQPVGIRVHLSVLGDVPIWHPWIHHTKRKRLLRNVDDGEHVWMGNKHAPTDVTTEDLGWSVLSTPLMRGMVTYTFYFLHAARILCTNCFYAYRLPAIISLPDIHESTGCVVRAVITKFHVGEDS